MYWPGWAQIGDAAPIGADTARIVKEQIDIVGRIAIIVQVVVDRVVHEVAHHAFRFRAAQEIDFRVADGLVDQGLIARVTGPGGQLVLDGHVFGDARADGDRLPG